MRDAPVVTDAVERGRASAGTLRWAYTAVCPPDWGERLARCGGGFFHSPAGLLAGAPLGEPVFATLWEGSAVAAIAVGVRSGCRFSLGARHAYFPSLPAFATDGTVARDAALAELVQLLRRRGAAEVVAESYDAPWEVAATWNGAADQAARLEYLVHLDAPPEELAARGGTTHRRYLRRGDREPWTFRQLAGEGAARVLRALRGHAAQRAAGRGRAFDPAPAERAIRAAIAEPGPGWGTTVFAAWRDEPVAAVLLGWANGRAFYIAGGSSPEGYRCGAAVWLHWQIIRLLSARGFAVYNLGGSPLGASAPGHPAHGLYRFKTDFGATVHARRGLHWVLSPLHLSAHRARAWAQHVVPALPHSR